MDKQSLQDVLRLISQTIDALSQEQIDALFAGKGQLVFAASETQRKTPVQPQAAPTPAPPPAPETAQAAPKPAQAPPAKGRRKPGAKSPPAAPVDFDDLWARLVACQDRSEAKTLLGSVKLKETLAELGRLNKLSVQGSLRRDIIEDKLIEFTVGSRLRREAIHSLDLRETRRPGGD